MDLEKLRNVIIDQAKYFLENAGEFYPFGAFIKDSNEIVPLGVQLEKEYPDPKEVILVLEESIIDKLKGGRAIAAAIGTDVDYLQDGMEKKTAIQIRVLQRNGESVDYYLPYKKENEIFAYEKLFEEKGSLSFMRKV